MHCKSWNSPQAKLHVSVIFHMNRSFWGDGPDSILSQLWGRCYLAYGEVILLIYFFLLSVGGRIDEWLMFDIMQCLSLNSSNWNPLSYTTTTTKDCVCLCVCVPVISGNLFVLMDKWKNTLMIKCIFFCLYRHYLLTIQVGCLMLPLHVNSENSLAQGSQFNYINSTILS